MEMEKVEAYCVKEKAKHFMKDPKVVEFKGKGGVVRNAWKGVCENCGTVMFRIMSKKK